MKIHDSYLSPLEKEFFESFEIALLPRCAKPKLRGTSFCSCYEECEGCDYRDYEYPPLTDSMYLSLLVYLSSEAGVYKGVSFALDTVEEFRKELLSDFIEIIKNPLLKKAKKRKFKEGVQNLFKKRDMK